MSTSGQSENSPVLSSVIAYFSSSLWMLHCVQSCLHSDLIHIQWNLCKRFHTLRFAEVSEKHLGRPEYIQGRSKAAGRRKSHSRRSSGQKEEIWPINRFYKDRLFHALFGAEERKELTREISEWHEESSYPSSEYSGHWYEHRNHVNRFYTSSTPVCKMQTGAFCRFLEFSVGCRSPPVPIPRRATMKQEVQRMDSS